MEQLETCNKHAGAQSRAGEAGANLTDVLGAVAEHGQMYLHHDDVSNRLDEMADLCEHWKRWREGRDYTPQSVRAALVMLAREVVILADFEQKHGPRMEPIGRK